MYIGKLKLNNHTILLTCHFLRAMNVFNRDKSSLAIGHEGTPVPFGFNVCQEKNMADTNENELCGFTFIQG